MNRIIKKASRVWKTAVLVTAFLAGTIGSSPAGEVAEVLPINPVPEFQAGESGTTSPDDMIIHGRGLIQRIGAGEMVIGDMLLPISSSVTYYAAKTGDDAEPAEFKVGTSVGFRLNDKRAIIELWLLDE